MIYSERLQNPFRQQCPRAFPIWRALFRFGLERDEQWANPVACGREARARWPCRQCGHNDAPHQRISWSSRLNHVQQSSRHPNWRQLASFVELSSILQFISVLLDEKERIVGLLHLTNNHAQAQFALGQHLSMSEKKEYAQNMVRLQQGQAFYDFIFKEILLFFLIFA